MQFINRLSSASTSSEIIHELTKDIDGQFDLGILFLSEQNPVTVQEISRKLSATLNIKKLLGCTCAGIIGSQEEIEFQTAASLILAKLPDVKIDPFYLNQSDMESLNQKEDWYKKLEVYPNENPVFIALPDPFMIDLHKLIDGLNAAYPQCPIVGGLASAGTQPNENSLILDQNVYDQGVVGLILRGNIDVNTVVSQGCRPIGENFIVTKAEDNIVYELAGKPFIDILKEVLEKSSQKDQVLAQEAIFIGIAISEYRDKFKRGDFLIRGLMGIDQNTGAGLIGDYIKHGQTIQFHVRDAQAATEDLNEMLTQYQKSALNKKPEGALLFSCNGRGQGLFKQKDHDVKIIQRHIGPIPLAGFFCAGEIGPVSGSNFLHGFTDSIALFYPKKSN